MLLAVIGLACSAWHIEDLCDAKEKSGSDPVVLLLGGPRTGVPESAKTICNTLGSRLDPSVIFKANDHNTTFISIKKKEHILQSN